MAKIGFNSIGAIGAKAIGEELILNPYLIELNLGRNKIGDEGAKEIAIGLEYSQFLNNLFLSTSFISLIYNRQEWNWRGWRKSYWTCSAKEY